MARKTPPTEVSRRKFLSGVAVAGAAVTATKADAATPGTTAVKRLPSALPPTAHQIAVETEVPKDSSPLGGRAGSDFMVDVIKATGIDYIYSNPASSFRGIHESIINYGGNTKPEFIECMPEQYSIA